MAITSADPKVDQFSSIAASLSEHGCLAEPALLLAADEYPLLDIPRYLSRLDDLADSALSAAITDADNDCEAARRLAVFLASTQGFAGNADNFYDPANSYLNEVMDRRVGIPITLSILLIEVGMRIGIPLVGIGLPCHFLTGCLGDGDACKPTLLLDPFNGGAVVDEAECTDRLTRVGIEFSPEEHLKPVDDRQILVRMLANLKAVYLQKGDFNRAIWAIMRQTQLDRAQVDGYRQLGLQLTKDGDFTHAQICLRRYLDVAPEGEQANHVRAALSLTLERLARRN